MPNARIVAGDGPRIAAGASQGDRWASVFTSLPDAAETGQDMPAWRSWFLEAAVWTIAATDPNGYAVFYQTDRRIDGGLESKASLIIEAAKAAGARVVWHKIAVRRLSVDLFRPAYTHLIAVSAKGTAGRPTPDVFTAGAKVYPNATDDASLDVTLGFLHGKGIRFVADPFCGRGSIARHAAKQYGMDSLSVDLDPAQVNAAAALVAPHATVTVGGVA